jgi:hypothetical protein
LVKSIHGSPTANAGIQKSRIKQTISPKVEVNMRSLKLPQLDLNSEGASTLVVPGLLDERQH